MKRLLPTGLILIIWISAKAQTPLLTDGLMVPRKDLGIGFFYGNDQWKNYWEGTLKRSNGNIGTVTTQSVTWMGAYGLSDKVSLIATLPYIWTKSSSGTLHGQQGFQDVTLAAKYNFYHKEFGENSLKFFALGSYSMPVTNYETDFLPLSIGLGSTNLSGRLTGTYSLKNKWYATGSGAYTWRSNIWIDRSSYFTNGQLYFSDEVQMYNVFDFIFRTGYNHGPWSAEIYYTQQNTLGGGDIRRQDMPFASNRMNYSKIGASVIWMVPRVKNLMFRAWGNYTVAGRNVGQSTTVTAGFMYAFHFSKPQ
jgi:hypothetical protein